MTRICPSCGYRTPDDQSRFCNQCGYPFPEEPERGAAAPPGGGAPRAARTGSGHSAGAAGFLSFGTLITRRFIRWIYLAGAVVIVLVSIMGIAGSAAKPGAGPVNASFLNTTALAENPAGSPLFWIVMLVVGSLLWRIFCEICVVLLRVHDALISGGGPLAGDEGEDDGEAERPLQGTGGPAEYVKCPRCGNVVTTDQLRECDHCGVQGCSSCIRLTGLVRKTMTCKDCFEGK